VCGQRVMGKAVLMAYKFHHIRKMITSNSSGVVAEPADYIYLLTCTRCSHKGEYISRP